MFSSRNLTFKEHLIAGHWHSVKFLLQKGVSLESIHGALFVDYMKRMSKAEHIDFECLEVWLQKSIEVNRTTELGWTPLHLAAYENSSIIPSSATLQYNTSDLLGWTPLHVAAWKGRADVVHDLLNLGAKVDAKDILGYTPLHLAARGGYDNVVTELLSNGANVNAETKINGGETPFFLAAVSGHLTVLKLLHQYKARFLAPSGVSILFDVAEKGYTPIVEWLIEHGERIDSRNWPCNRSWDEVSNESILHVAIRGRHRDLVTFLLKTTILLEGYTMREETPLHYAALLGDEVIVAQLISKGANVNAVDRSEATPLYYAEHRGNVEAAKLIKDAGGKNEHISHHFRKNTN